MPIGINHIAALVLAAQGAGAMPPIGGERATLLQLGVAIPKTGPAALQQAFVEETAQITSCAEGLGVGQRLKARGLHGTLSFNVKTAVPLAALPAPLRAALLARPIGRATPPFGDGEALRVLIRCEPSFVVPGQVSLTPERRRPRPVI